MLVVQNISFEWGKGERGAEYAKARAGFPMAYLVEQKPFSGKTMVQKPFSGEAAEQKLLSDKAVVQTLHFWQKGTEFIDCMQKARSKWIWQYYSHLKDLNLANILITMKGDVSPLEVIFFYDEHRSGKPFRRGHNKDYHDVQSPLYRKDCLNETAFILEKGQYGRIVWNERKTDFDTGEWYYQLHILNLYHLWDNVLKSDIFTVHVPDFEYRQMAELK